MKSEPPSPCGFPDDAPQPTAGSVHADHNANTNAAKLTPIISHIHPRSCCGKSAIAETATTIRNRCAGAAAPNIHASNVRCEIPTTINTTRAARNARAD